MKVYPFPRGGISFNDSCVPSAVGSTLSFLPSITLLPLKGQTGNESFPVVAAGDHVGEGALIARAQGAGSSNIHATIPGKISRSVQWTIGGLDCKFVVIKLEGKFDKLGRKEEKERPWQDISPYKLRSIISNYGITEMDDAGRPIIDVFSEFDAASRPFTLVVRCIFDDPWLAADRCLCKERCQIIAKGAVIAAKASGARQIFFAASSADAQLCKNLLEETSKYNFPSFMILTGARYPQHFAGEIGAILRKYEKTEKVPIGPPLVTSASTIAAIADAVLFGKPALERYVAVGGSAIRAPQVLKVRIGSRIGDIINECGGFCKNPSVIAVDSPLLGRKVKSLDEPILKTTRAVFAIAESKSERFFKTIKNMIKTSISFNCINCGECRRVCPAGLDPEDIFKHIKDDTQKESLIPLIMKCLGCGCCEAVCPSKIQLATGMVSRAFKGEERAGS